MSKVQLTGFKDSAALTRWTKLFIYFQMIVALLAIIINYLEYDLLFALDRGVYISPVLLEESDTRQQLVMIVKLIAYLVSGVLILKWIYRASFNAHQLGEYLSMSPGWSIGWYFIPVANLWKPYQAMKEIWDSSTNPDNRRALAKTRLLPSWWGLWLGWNILTNVSYRMYESAEGVDAVINANLLNQLSNVILIALCVVLLVVINKIHLMQTARANHMA